MSIFSRKAKDYVKAYVFFLLIFCLAESAQAKSVYAIADHGGGKIKAYKIQDDQIRYQTKVKNLPPCYIYIPRTTDNMTRYICVFWRRKTDNLYLTYDENLS